MPTRQAVPPNIPKPTDDFSADQTLEVGGPVRLPWWRRHFEALVTATTLGLVVVLITIVLALQGRTIDHSLPDNIALSPRGPANAWLDPRYAAGVASSWPTDDQVLVVAPNREIIVTQVWVDDLVPGLAGLDLWTGEQRWRRDALNCWSQGFLDGRGLCVDENTGAVVDVDLDTGSTTPFLNWPTPVDSVFLAGRVEGLQYLQLRTGSDSELAAVDDAGQVVWSTEGVAGSCELLVAALACPDATGQRLSVYEAESGVLRFTVEGPSGSVEVFADGYVVSDAQGLHGYDFQQSHVADFHRGWPADYPARPDRVYQSLRAFASQAAPTVWDASGVVHFELADGRWIRPEGSSLVKLSTPEAISADGSVLLLFGSDETGNYLRLTDRAGVTIAQVADEPSAVYDGIVVIDFVVYPPAG